MPYTWGEPSGCLPQAPDIIIGADVVYEQEHYPALVSTLRMLAAPHTVVYLSYRLRGMPPPSSDFVKKADDTSSLADEVVLENRSTFGGCSTLHMCSG